MIRVMRALRPGVLVLAGVLAPATPALGQVPTLARVDSLVNAGSYDDARQDLDRWWSARDQFVVPGSDMARALMLRARLAPDPATAEPDYLAVVLGYPASEHAPEALLRLGQGLLATGDATRAAAYLGRLIADYPGRPQRLTGLLWLARAHAAARRPGPACTAARQGLQDARDPDLATMLRAEVESSCAAVARSGDAATDDATVGGTDAAPVGAPVGAPVEAPRGARQEPTPGSAAASPGDAAAGDWAVQTGAFRYRAGADRLVEQLREAGYSPRLVRLPGSDLLRVRVGRFEGSGEAAELVTRLRGRGFEAVVVGDAAQERSP